MDSKRAAHGQELFTQGCNCAQAVLMAYGDELGLSPSQLMRLGSSFGGGMGRLREVCGTVSAMFMVAGLLCGYEDAADREAKASHYKLIQELAAKFKEKNGSIICLELLGLKKPEGTYVPEERTDQYYKKRPCGNYIACAIDILEEWRSGKAAEIS